MPKPDELLTTSQASTLTGKSPRTIQRLVTKGTLTPALQLAGPNGAYLFHRLDIEALAAA